LTSKKIQKGGRVGSGSQVKKKRIESVENRWAWHSKGEDPEVLKDEDQKQKKQKQKKTNKNPQKPQNKKKKKKKKKKA